MNDQSLRVSITERTRQKDTLERLDHWQRGHKDRYAEIELDAGQGGKYWMVVLMTELPSNIPEGSIIRAYESAESPEHIAKLTGYPRTVCVWNVETDSPPGLCAVINAALDYAEDLARVGR